MISLHPLHLDCIAIHEGGGAGTTGSCQGFGVSSANIPLFPLLLLLFFLIADFFNLCEQLFPARSVLR